MAKFFRMTADTNLEAWVSPGEPIGIIAAACRASEFQFLDHVPLTVEISDNGGLDFPDFLLNFDIPLISPRFRQILEAMRVDNLFYKPVYLADPLRGRNESYFLALPPRIMAVREKYMQLVDEDGDPDEGKELCKDEYGIARYKINAANVGNYQIFKISAVLDTDIIVTEKLQQSLSAANLQNVCFSEIEEE